MEPSLGGLGGSVGVGRDGLSRRGGTACAETHKCERSWPFCGNEYIPSSWSTYSGDLESDGAVTCGRYVSLAPWSSTPNQQLVFPA